MGVTKAADRAVDHALGRLETRSRIMDTRRILVVDDEEPIRKGVSRIALALGHEVDVAASAEDALRVALVTNPDLVITDLSMPGRNGMQLVEDLRDHGIDSTTVVLTAHATIDSAIEATRRGVYDYLVKPVEPERLQTVILKALEHAAMHQEVLELRRELQRTGRYQQLVGKSAAMQELYHLLNQIAPTNAPVLVTGESGTGKEVVARTIHSASPRRASRFVAINCAAIPETLLESEIFGHEKGAFTGATFSRAGCFEHAHEGTLFLDEIGDMPLGLQSKLLRVLEDGRVRRVGGTREIPVDVRVIAATNADVELSLSRGKLREDLYFRLNVFTLHLPPLRTRKEDISLLAMTFLESFTRENTKTIAGFSEACLDLMLRYDWPGNVRELRNVVQRAVILCGEEEIQPQHLSPAVRPTVRREPGPKGALVVAVGMPLEDVERAVILETLEACAGNKTRAASMLGITTKTLYTKLRRYGRFRDPAAEAL